MHFAADGLLRLHVSRSEFLMERDNQASDCRSEPIPRTMGKLHCGLAEAAEPDEGVVPEVAETLRSVVLKWGDSRRWLPHAQSGKCLWPRLGLENALGSAAMIGSNQFRAVPRTSSMLQLRGCADYPSVRGAV